MRRCDTELFEILIEDFIFRAFEENDIQSGELLIEESGLQFFSHGQRVVFGVDIEESKALLLIKRAEEIELAASSDIAVTYAVQPAVLFFVVRELAVSAVIGLFVAHDLRDLLGHDVCRVEAVFL